MASPVIRWENINSTYANLLTDEGSTGTLEYVSHDILNYETISNHLVYEDSVSGPRMSFTLPFKQDENTGWSLTMQEECQIVRSTFTKEGEDPEFVRVEVIQKRADEDDPTDFAVWALFARNHDKFVVMENNVCFHLITDEMIVINTHGEFAEEQFEYDVTNANDIVDFIYSRVNNFLESMWDDEEPSDMSMFETFKDRFDFTC